MSFQQLWTLVSHLASVCDMRWRKACHVLCYSLWELPFSLGNNLETAVFCTALLPDISRNAGLISSRAKYNLMVPAWCHLCWHLELTVWKCILELPFTAWSLHFYSGPLPSFCTSISLWHTCWHLLPLFTEQSPLQSSYPNPPIFSRSPPLRTERLLCNPPGLQLPSSKARGNKVPVHIIQKLFLMWEFLIHWNWTFVEQEAGIRWPPEILAKLYASTSLKTSGNADSHQNWIADMTAVIPQELFCTVFPSWQNSCTGNIPARNLFCWLGVGVFIAVPSEGSCCFTCIPENSTTYTQKSCAMWTAKFLRPRPTLLP